MKKPLFFAALSALTLATGCSTPDTSEYFHGTLSTVDDFPRTDRPPGTPIEPEYPKFIHLAVYDTLGILFSWDNPYGFYNVHSLPQGKHLGYFCQRGQAPNESAGVDPLFYFYTEDGDVKTDVMTVNRTLTKWNITHSLATGQTEIDTSYAFTWSDVCQRPYRAYFRLSADSLLVFTQPDRPFQSATSTLADTATAREYHLFRRTIEGGTNASFPRTTISCSRPL